MAQFAANRTLVGTFADTFANLRADITVAIKRRSVFRNTYNELAQLTDRDLSDLGLSRSTIKSVAYEAAQKV